MLFEFDLISGLSNKSMINSQLSDKLSIIISLNPTKEKIIYKYSILSLEN